MRRSTLFVCSAATILLISAAAKLVSAAGNTDILDLADPLLGLPFRVEYVLVGAIELLVAAFCVFGRDRRLQLWMLAWLATSFGVYRLGLHWIGIHYCKCFGTLPDTFQLPAKTANGIALGLLAYLLLGSYWGICRAWATSGSHKEGDSGP